MAKHWYSHSVFFKVSEKKRKHSSRNVYSGFYFLQNCRPQFYRRSAKLRSGFSRVQVLRRVHFINHAVLPPICTALISCQYRNHYTKNVLSSGGFLNEELSWEMTITSKFKWEHEIKQKQWPRFCLVIKSFNKLYQSVNVVVNF